MATIILAMLVFAVIHSLMARSGIKTGIRHRINERTYYGLYRLVYNIIAGLTFVPVLIVAAAAPGPVLWRADGILFWGLVLIQLIGLIGLIVSLLQIDLGQFTGLSQVRAYVSGKPLPLPTEPLQTGGVYRLVRHPLYLFWLMVIWATPLMTESLLVFNIAVTLYFIIGSRLEERQLVKVFGQPYVEYQQRVPWMIPFLMI